MQNAHGVIGWYKQLLLFNEYCIHQSNYINCQLLLLVTTLPHLEVDHLRGFNNFLWKYLDLNRYLKRIEPSYFKTVLNLQITPCRYILLKVWKIGRNMFIGTSEYTMKNQNYGGVVAMTIIYRLVGSNATEFLKVIQNIKNDFTSY